MFLQVHLYLQINFKNEAEWMVCVDQGVLRQKRNIYYIVKCVGSERRNLITFHITKITKGLTNIKIITNNKIIQMQLINSKNKIKINDYLKVFSKCL